MQRLERQISGADEPEHEKTEDIARSIDDDE